MSPNVNGIPRMRQRDEVYYLEGVDEPTLRCLSSSILRHFAETLDETQTITLSSLPPRSSKLRPGHRCVARMQPAQQKLVVCTNAKAVSECIGCFNFKGAHSMSAPPLYPSADFWLIVTISSPLHRYQCVFHCRLPTPRSECKRGSIDFANVPGFAHGHQCPLAVRA